MKGSSNDRRILQNMGIVFDENDIIDIQNPPYNMRVSIKTLYKALAD